LCPNADISPLGVCRHIEGLKQMLGIGTSYELKSEEFVLQKKIEEHGRAIELHE
jgi:hypothetical protein